MWKKESASGRLIAIFRFGLGEFAELLGGPGTLGSVT